MGLVIGTSASGRAKWQHWNNNLVLTSAWRYIDLVMSRETEYIINCIIIKFHIDT